MADVFTIFEPSCLKIERASQHLEELTLALAKHEVQEPPVVTFTEGTSDKPLSIHVGTRSPPKIVGAIVGDIVHNLRASLDLMAVRLAEITSGKGEGEGVYFPFCDEAALLPKMIKKRKFYKAGPDAVNLLMSLQPYKGGNVALRALHDLDVQDKHHTLIANSAVIMTPQLTADTSDFPNVRIRLAEGSQAQVLVVFPTDSPLPEQEMVPTLHELVKLVQEILETFAGLVATRPQTTD